MTNKEAVKTLLTGMYRGQTGIIVIDKSMEDDFLYAIGMAISVLMKEEEKDRKHLWHSVKEDPPEKIGLYYCKKDGFNSIFTCYFDGNEWVNNSCKDQIISVDEWAEYAEFNSVD